MNHKVGAKPRNRRASLQMLSVAAAICALLLLVFAYIAPAVAGYTMLFDSERGFMRQISERLSALEAELGMEPAPGLPLMDLPEG